MNRFKELRKQRHLTQAELIKQYNERYNRTYSIPALSLFENGHRLPELPALKDFAEFFDVSVDYLIGRIPDVNLPPGKTPMQLVMESEPHTPTEAELKQEALNRAIIHDAVSSSGLTAKEERDIESDLEDMMNSMASAAYEGDKDNEEDIEILKATLKAAMMQAKKVAKKKYTPKKYRRD